MKLRARILILILATLLIALPAFSELQKAVRLLCRPKQRQFSELTRSVGHSCALAQAGISPDGRWVYCPSSMRSQGPLLISVTYSGMGGGPYLEFLLFEDGLAVAESEKSKSGIVTWQASPEEMREYRSLIEKLRTIQQSDITNNIFRVTDLGRTCYQYKLADGSTRALSIEGSIGDCFWLMSSDEMSTLSYAPPSVLDIYYKTHAVPESGTTWLPQNLQIDISPIGKNPSKQDSREIAIWKPSVGTANALLRQTKLQ